MNVFKVTKDRRILLDDTEIKRVLGYSINADAGSDPEVVLRIAVDEIDIDGYTDSWSKLDLGKQEHSGA